MEPFRLASHRNVVNDKLGDACVGDKNVMHLIVDAVKEYATLQEVCDVFRGVFGEYRDPGIY